MSVSDKYGNNLYKQKGSDNRHSQTGNEINSGWQNTGHIQNGSQPVQQAKRIRMIGCHDPVTPDHSIAMKHIICMGLADESGNMHTRRNENEQSAL